jgi:plasmid stabilization system protein ParE
MKWIVLVRSQAERDLESARDWYIKRRTGLGDEFLDEVADGMRLLGEDPLRERPYYRNFRRILLRRFPCKIFYQVIGHRVIVFRVLHAKQDHGQKA